MAKVFLAFRGHGNVSSDDARKIADCAAALREACEAAGIESRASVEVSGDAAPARAGEPDTVAVESAAQEFAAVDVPEVAAVRTGKPKGSRR
jgi:hypothetical protein